MMDEKMLSFVHKNALCAPMEDVQYKEEI